MAVVWGPIIEDSNSRLRIGIDIDFVSETASTLTARAQFYVWTKYAISDTNNTFVTSGWLGSYSGNVSINTSSGSAWSTANQKLLRTQENVVLEKYYGSVRNGAVLCSLKGVEAVGIANKATANASFIVPARAYAAPAAPSSFTHVRNSDTHNTVSWSSNSTTAAPYASVLLERSTNGGAWLQIANLPGTVTSYADTTTSENNSYRYRARALNSTGASGYSAISAATHNTPATPGTPKASLISISSAALSWPDEPTSANQWEIERTVNGGASAPIPPLSGINYIDGSVPAGTVAYRVRAVNTRGTVLKSAWSPFSNSITAIAPPAAPTLTPMASIIDSRQPTVRAVWTHNSVDGSAQSAYELEIDGDVYTGETEKYFNVDTDTLGIGLKQWRVRTKGLHESWSPWSAYSSFAVYTPPQVAFTSPTIDGEDVTDFPLVIAWNYTDTGGTQASFALAIVDVETGRVLYSKSEQNADKSLTLGIADLVPPDDKEYKIELTVRSSTSLYAAGARYFTTRYNKPAEPLVYAETEDDKASSLITVYAGIGEELPATESLSLYRVCGDEEYLIASELDDGESVTDFTPPVGAEFSYRVIAVSPTGAVASGHSEPMLIQVKGFFINFGAGLSEVAKVLHDINYGPDDYDSGQVLVQFEGREDPSLFNSSVRTMTSSLSGSLIGSESLRAFRSLAEWGKRAWFRSPAGASYPCAVSVALTNLPHQHKKASVDLKISRLSHD